MDRRAAERISRLARGSSFFFFFFLLRSTKGSRLPSGRETLLPPGGGRGVLGWFQACFGLVFMVRGRRLVCFGMVFVGRGGCSFLPSVRLEEEVEQI